jgi:hypothetical protein
MSGNTKFLLQIGLTVLFGFFVSARISIFDNPEVKFWAQFFEEKDDEVSFLESPKIVFVGGSSCTFSVDSKIIEEKTGWPAYNYGGIAFMGPRYMFTRVKEHLKAGDVLVIGYEPEILKGIDGEKSYPLGRKIPLVTGEYTQISEVSTSKKNFQRWMEAVRPGLRLSMVSLVRFLIGGRSYAYTSDDKKEGGRLELGQIDYQLPARKKLEILPLEKPAIDFMREVVAFCRKKEVTCVYTIPWQGTSSDYVAINRKVRQEFLAELGVIISFLHDPEAGVIEGLEGFSDSEYHLGAEMSRKRSNFLGESLEKFLK